MSRWLRSLSFFLLFASLAVAGHASELAMTGGPYVQSPQTVVNATLRGVLASVYKDKTATYPAGHAYPLVWEWQYDSSTGGWKNKGAANGSGATIPGENTSLAGEAAVPAMTFYETLLDSSGKAIRSQHWTQYVRVAGLTWDYRSPAPDAKYTAGSPVASGTGQFLDAGGTVFNVVVYGATGNGSTDDYPYVVLAQTAAIESGGGTLYFPAGTYRINSDIAFASNVRLRFAPGASVYIATGKVLSGGDGIEALTFTQIFKNALYGQGTANLNNPVYYPEWWGAKADGVALTGLSVPASSTAMTFTAGQLTSANVNQRVAVQGAAGDGGGFGYGNYLNTTITAVNTTTHVATLAAPATRTVSGVTGFAGSDNGRAFQATGEALNAQGGGDVEFRPGIYRVFGVETDYTDTADDSHFSVHANGPDTAVGEYHWHNAFYLTNLNGATFRGHGTTLAVDPGQEFEPPHPYGNVFSVYACKNLTFDGFTMTGPNRKVPQSDANSPHHLIEFRESGITGVQFVYLLGASKNIDLPNNIVGGGTGLWAFAQFGDAQDESPENIHVGNLYVHDALYGVKFNDAGANSVIDNLQTDEIHRSVYLHGTHDVRVNVRSRNFAAQDFLMAAYGGRSTQNVWINYHFTASDRNETGSHILFQFTDDSDDPDPDNGGQGTFRNIHVSGEITCSDNPTTKRTGDSGVNGSSYYWTCGVPIEFISGNAVSGATDSPGLDRRLENVTFENFYVSGPPHSLYETEQSKPSFVQSFYRNVNFRGGGTGAEADLRVSGGSVSTSFLNYVGDGYATAPTVTATGGGCSEEPQITATRSSVTGRLTGLLVDPDHPGVGCMTAPTLTFSSEANPWDANVSIHNLTFRNCYFNNNLNMRLFGAPVKDAITFDNVTMGGAAEVVDMATDMTAAYKFVVTGSSFPNRDNNYLGVWGITGWSFAGDVTLPATAYGKTITNTGALAARTLTLPPAVAGREPITFERTAGFNLTAAPQGFSDLVQGGNPVLTITGQKVVLRCDSDGTWLNALTANRLDLAGSWPSTFATGDVNDYLMAWSSGGTNYGGILGTGGGSPRVDVIANATASLNLGIGSQTRINMPNGASLVLLPTGIGLGIGGGSVLNKVSVLPVTVNSPTPVAGNSTVEIDVSVAGTMAGDIPFLVLPGQTTGLIFGGYCRVTSNGHIAVPFVNTTGGALTPPTGTYIFFVVRYA